MPKLPLVSHKKLTKLLNQFGYNIERQRGSHMRLKKILHSGQHSVTIPAHKEIARGTLNDILEKISYHVNLSKQELINMLSGL